MLAVMPDGGEKIAEVMIVQRVEDVAAGAARADEPERAQQAQVVGRRAEAQLCDRGELLDRTLAVDELREHAEAARRRQRPERLGELLSLAAFERAPGGSVLGGMRHTPILYI